MIKRLYVCIPTADFIDSGIFKGNSGCSGRACCHFPLPHGWFYNYTAMCGSCLKIVQIIN